MDLFTLLCFGAILVLLFCLPRVAMDSLAITGKVTLSITAQKNITGSDYSPNTNSTTIGKTITVGTAVANAGVSGGDEVYSAVTSLAGSASASIDLTAFTDLLNQTSAAFARVKLLCVRVLSVLDDSVIGTAASAITIDGTVASGLLSVAGTGWLTNITSKFDVPNGGILFFGTPAAAGIACATAKIIKVTNVDSVVTAKCQITAAGGST